MQNYPFSHGKEIIIVRTRVLSESPWEKHILRVGMDGVEELDLILVCINKIPDISVLNF